MTMASRNLDLPEKKVTRPIKACTSCRQQKIKCDAASTLPGPCSSCKKHGRKCIVDAAFRPRKGGQVELLREDIITLKRELETLKSTEQAPVLIPGQPLVGHPVPMAGAHPAIHPGHIASTIMGAEPLGKVRRTSSYADHISPGSARTSVASIQGHDASESTPSPNVPAIIPHNGPYHLDRVTLTADEAESYHRTFIAHYLPYLPIFESQSAGELYSQSEMLFWSVMLTASSTDQTPDLYLQLVESVKALSMRVCWMETPRSTHVVQALLVLSTWPLPNEKVLDDMSYRFTNLARSLALQLGMHRGKFIYEFSRKQKLMPNAVKWRTRTWLATYVSEQFLSAALGLPSNMPVDYLVDKSVNDLELPEALRAQVKLAMFYSKMGSIMGSSITTPDGLLEPKLRCPTLDVLSHDLDQLAQTLPLANPFIEIVYLYVRCMLGCFAFLPDTPEADQSRFIVDVFHASTRLITVMRVLVGKRRITEFPAIVRHASSFAALLLFRLHLAPQFPMQYVESARQSVVTVHHLYRNVAPAWQGVQNDVTRIAKILESLNHVLIGHPYLLTGQRRIMSRMRSHLTYSIFYELIWAVHEARRRNTKTQKEAGNSVPQPLVGPAEPPSQSTSAAPLPLFNQISTDAYSTYTYTSPNGTTTTRLVKTQAPTPKEEFSDSVERPDELPTDLDSLLQGIDWMNTEGDDFLGWMPNAEFTL